MREEFILKAIYWMTSRGWKHKLAKRRTYEQSLFEHTLVELDVLTALLPILVRPQHYGLTEAEAAILLVAVVVHDVGKETNSWQAYISDSRPVRSLSHIYPELTRSVVPELCAITGLEGQEEAVQQIMALCAEFHHSRSGKSNGAILEAVLTGGTDRFQTMANLVKGIDHFCSAVTAAEAKHALENDPALGHHLNVVSHMTALRGVSTAFLHKAARTAFQQRGWNPLLYFADATVYGGDPNDGLIVPSALEIEACLKNEIDAAISRDVTPLMVGSPTGNILPKPDLLSFVESRKYLESAGRDKISPQSFARKKLTLKRKVVEDYWKLKARAAKPTDEQVDQEAVRISEAQPEMLVFKFFKAMMDPDKIEVIGNDGAALAEKLYEETFGAGSWGALQSTSTLMPARDMAKTIDYFWSVLGSAVGHKVASVAELPPETRLQLLITLLDGIAQKVYSTINRPSPRDKLSQSMASASVKDLSIPATGSDIRALAEKQLAHYAQSKPFAGKESSKARYFCPICNVPFTLEDGIKASADFIDNPQTHTNRGVALGSFGYVMVCTTCYYERLLHQVLLGTRPAEVITLLPRLNFGPGKGEQLTQGVRTWVEAAKAQMRGESGDLEFGFSLGLTDQVARHLANRDPFTLQSNELLKLFSYRFTADTQKKRRREALRRLKEEFDDDLDFLNTACGQAFSAWEEAVEALVEDRVQQQEFKAIRREVFRLFESMHLICETPNLVFIPLAYEVAARDDESETNKALRRLYVALILSVVFDASVAIHRENELVDFRGRIGAAYVPRVPAVRSLIGWNWVPITEVTRWLSAIGAASRLMRDTDLPVRSALYQILASDPAERIARRIEQAGTSLTPRHLGLIEQLPSFKPSIKKGVLR